MRCIRMCATIRHTVCLEFQNYYLFLGEPCRGCRQGEMVKCGIYNDADIENLIKMYSDEKKFCRKLKSHGIINLRKNKKGGVMDQKLFKKAIKELNETNLADFQVDLKLKGGELISEFLSACESVPVEKENDLPESVTKMYNTLSTPDKSMDITDYAAEAQVKEKEMKGKEKPAKKPAKVEKPKKEKVEKPKKEKVEKPVVEKKEKVKRTDTKILLAENYVREHPGTDMYTLRQQPWNEKNDSYYNHFNRLIKGGKMKKEGKGYFINE